ncbi:hypothetical protein [Cutibacterium modestum]|uniref:hypothetical protein n=1 Tax=Cutibacterium modestum TaxID=2559073 RepID=UPI003AAD8CAF
MVRRLVNEAVAHPSIDLVSFTGGDAFLRRGFILKLIRTVSSAGKRTTLVLNGF